MRERTGPVSSEPELSRNKNSSLTICRADLSKEVAQFYLDNRYNFYEECHNPCEKMIISSMFSYKSEGYNYIKFVFATEVHVIKEKLKVSFDLLLGEIGGFVGMILGRAALFLYNDQLDSLSLSRSFSDGPGQICQNDQFTL